MMRQPEWIVAEELVEQVPPQGYVIADGNYDKNRLYDRAGRNGRQLLTHRYKGKNPGHRRQSPYRLAALAMDARKRRRLLRGRGTIDRAFSELYAAGGRLMCLPSWVRRMHRVELWVEAKFILCYLRIRANQSTEVA